MSQIVSGLLVRRQLSSVRRHGWPVILPIAHFCEPSRPGQRSSLFLRSTFQSRIHTRGASYRRQEPECKLDVYHDLLEKHRKLRKAVNITNERIERIEKENPLETYEKALALPLERGYRELAILAEHIAKGLAASHSDLPRCLSETAARFSEASKMHDRTIEDLARLQEKYFDSAAEAEDFSKQLQHLKRETLRIQQTFDTKKCRDLWNNLALVIAITRWRETEEPLAAVRSTLEKIRAQKAAIGKIHDHYLSPMTTTANSYFIHETSRRKIVEGILRIICLTPDRRQLWTEARRTITSLRQMPPNVLVDRELPAMFDYGSPQTSIRDLLREADSHVQRHGS